MKTIAYSKSATKTLRRIPANVSASIVAKIKQFANDPASFGNNVKPLRGYTDQFRLRVGDWRVVMSDNGEVLSIIKIGPRGSVCED